MNDQHTSLSITLCLGVLHSGYNHSNVHLLQTEPSLQLRTAYSDSDKGKEADRTRFVIVLYLLLILYNSNGLSQHPFFVAHCKHQELRNIYQLIIKCYAPRQDELNPVINVRLTQAWVL